MIDNPIVKRKSIKRIKGRRGVLKDEFREAKEAEMMPAAAKIIYGKFHLIGNAKPMMYKYTPIGPIKDNLCDNEIGNILSHKLSKKGQPDHLVKATRLSRSSKRTRGFPSPDHAGFGFVVG
jgi:hypothetical protein